jgi:hypothetical protein
MQPKAQPTEVPVTVDDKVMLIPNDEALKDNATFIRAFENATLVRKKYSAILSYHQLSRLIGTV